MKKLALLLAVIMMLSAVLVACNNDDGGETESNSTSESVSESKSDTDSETDTESDSVTESVSDTDTDTETESETEEDYPYYVKQFTIAGVDLSQFTIVRSAQLADGYNDFIPYCVQELAKATGVTLPVIGESRSAEYEIVLGATARDTERVIAAREQIQYDGYAIVVDGGRLYITDKTGSGAGVAYGLAAFLEQYAGVTAYTSYYTAYHKMGVVEIPADLCTVSNPSFEGRNVDYYDIEHRQDNGHIRVFLGNNADGGYLDSIGGSIFVLTNGRGHTICELSGTGSSTSAMPCLTSDVIYSRLIQNVRAKLDATPDARTISVSVSDGVSQNCQCAGCKAIEKQYGGPSGLILWFVNKVADDIRDDYPNVLVETLAYAYVGDAPTGITAADNVAVRVCTYDCCFTHAITDPDCPRNTAFRENFEKWEKICDNLLLWDYPNNFAGPSVPDPSIFLQLENLRYFKQHGVIEYFGEGCDTSPNGEFDDLMAYLLAKILWNVDMTDEEYAALIDRAIADMYGDAAPYVKEYLVKRHEATSETGCTATYTALENFYKMVDEKGLPTTGTAKADTTFLLEMYALWQKAMSLDTLTEGQQKNLEMSSAHMYMAVSKLVKEKSIYIPAQQMYRRLCNRYGITAY